LADFIVRVSRQSTPTTATQRNLAHEFISDLRFALDAGDPSAFRAAQGLADALDGEAFTPNDPFLGEPFSAERRFPSPGDTSMMVIPSIIDFKAIGRSVILKPGTPEKTVNGSRIKGTDAITNGCTNRHDIVRIDNIRKQFFQQMHDNLLLPSLPFSSNIYAWEVQNEPSWNYRTIAAQSVAGGATVSEDDMRQFLQQGLDTINSVQLNGKPAFKTTVGHRFLEDLDDLPTGTRRQFHYYPFSLTPPSVLSPILPDIPVRDRELPRFNDTNAFLGEIGIEDPLAGHGDLWPDLDRADAGDTRTRVAARLQYAREQGYPLVLLWPDGIDGKGKAGPVRGPDLIHLSAAAQAGVIDFMRST